jgi:membrane fusion protein (multidrug efflux system)
MKVRHWIVAVSACLLLFAGLAAYKYSQIRAAIAFGESFGEPSETVESVSVEIRDMQEYVSTIGEIVAPQSVILRNELPGRIVAVNFSSGSKVSQGDTLVQFDIAEEQAQLTSAQARAELARLDLKRARALQGSQMVSEERIDQAVAQANVARAEVLALQAMIDKKTLRAPFDAVTGLHQFEPGDVLQANTEITTLVGISPFIWVDFSVPDNQAGIALGTEVIVAHPTEPETLLRAEVVARDSVVSAQSRNLRLRARLDNSAGLAPNTAVNVAVPVGQALARVHVPATAVRLDGLGDYVFVLEPDPGAGESAYRARRQAVTVGPQRGQWVAIMKGLQGGELVAANGAFKLRQNILVRLGERSPGGESAGPPSVKAGAQ